MNAAPGTDAYDRRESPWGRVYYWSDGSGMKFTHTEQESDVEALFERAVTVTPLSYVLTDHLRMQLWRERLGEKN
jgi:broad specificity polyphosphatase/5'/3'-nucleotidase SurE